MSAQRLVGGEQLHAAQQQLGKIDQTEAVAGFLIRLIEADQFALGRVVAAAELLRAPALFLMTIDKTKHLARRPVGLVEVKVLQGALDQPPLILGVENLEALRQAGLLPMRAQQTMRQAVKGANPHAAHRQIEQTLDAPAHLGGGLVGEGHGQNRVRRSILDRRQPGNPVGQHARLAGTGAGQHQQRPFAGRHRLALRVVEAIENRGYVHARIISTAGGGYCPKDV